MAESSSSDSKGKGKAVDVAARLRDPSSSSSNPSMSLSALWNYISPALDHIVRSPSNNTEKAPAIDVAYYLNIHTATYSFFTNSSTGRFGTDFTSPIDSPVSTLSPSSTVSGGTREKQDMKPHGTELYEKLDRYYVEACQEILAGHPIDDSNLIDYLLPCFQRYRAGAQSVHRLLNYVNRQFVRRAVEEDRGWLRLADIIFVQTQSQGPSEPQSKSMPTSPSSTMSAKSKSNKKKKKGGISRSGTPKPPNTKTNDTYPSLDTTGTSSTKDDPSSDPSNPNPRELIASRLQKRRLEELAKWGYNPSTDPPDRLTRAESSAEAASPQDRVVPLYALALRRFRTEVVSNLLAIPKVKKPGGKLIRSKRGGEVLGIGPGGVGAAGPNGFEAGGGEGGNGNVGPKSRLARAVRYLVEEDKREEEVRRRVAGEVNDMMEMVGVPGEHVLRKKLTRFSAQTKSGHTNATSKAEEESKGKVENSLSSS